MGGWLWVDGCGWVGGRAGSRFADGLAVDICCDKGAVMEQMGLLTGKFKQLHGWRAVYRVTGYQPIAISLDPG